MTTHAMEIATGERFEFGKNWSRFLALLNDQRIAVAEASLCEMLEVDSLAGKSFLDIGSGSGLFSLAARRLGARVHSFDFDPQSVACTMELRRRYFPDDSHWKVEVGSALDAEYLRSLGKFDVVYSWGVLHHTGELWQASANAAIPVAEGGKLFIALYNDTGKQSERWRSIKQTYNGLPRLLRTPFAMAVMAPAEIKSVVRSVLDRQPMEYVRSWTRYDQGRGMNRWHDLIDWVGGYPYEVATPEQVTDFFHQRGFSPARSNCNGTGLGCNEFVFVQNGVAYSETPPLIGSELFGPPDSTLSAPPAATAAPEGAYRKLRSHLSRSNIPGLDGMRALAVFLVIAYHFGFNRVPGSHGVMIFFVLSGFLITWLLLKESERTGTISLPGFYRRRVIRIFPAFYVFWILSIVLLLAVGRQVPWGHAWSAFFYVSNYYNGIYGDPSTAFSHTWSLAIEEQFYLLWPFVFLFLHKDLRRLTGALVGIIGAVWVYRLILVFGFEQEQSYLYASFDTRLDSLMVGCLLAVVLKREVLSQVWRLFLRPWFPVVTFGLLLASVFGGHLLLVRYRDVIGFAIEPVLIAILIAQIVARCDRLWWSWLNWGWVRFLGRISYSLYLYQQLTLFPARKMLQQYPIPVQFVGAIVITVLVAYLSYAIVERPFQRLRGREPQPLGGGKPANIATRETPSPGLVSG
ncbi:MAG: acyltransferase family protein [Pyrinomonadaceae bacterium]